MRKIVITSLCLFFVSSFIGAEQLTLENAISIGLNNNYNIQLQKNTTQKSQNNTSMATGYLLPTVDLQGGINFTHTNDLIEDIPASGMGGDNTRLATNAVVSLNWTLFDGLRMFKARGLVKEQAQQGLLQERAQIETSVLDIIKSYYAVVANQSALKIMQDRVDVSQSRYDRAKLKLEMGSLISRELLSSEIALNSDKSTLEDAKYKFEASKSQMNLLLARDIATEFTVVDSIDFVDLEYNRDEIYNIALEQNADLLNLKANVEIADKILGINRASYAPMIIASGSYGYNNANTQYDNAEADLENLQGTVGINLKWNIFNGFSDNVNSENSLLDKNNAEISENMYKTQLKSLVYNKYLEYQNYKNKKEYELISVKSAEKNLEVSTQLFKNGSITDIQFRQSQIELSSAKHNLILTQYNLRTIIADLQKLAGILKVN